MLLHFELEQKSKSDTAHDKRGIEIQVCHRINRQLCERVSVNERLRFGFKGDFFVKQIRIEKAKLLWTPNKLKTYSELKTMANIAKSEIKKKNIGKYAWKF